ncbi:hypothetical protein [Cryobacterium sp. CG_9.6]|uniref:hypothetical protein n=1 Tax=Cryobacterium sp. CG_9.6 TaxID=2760710 RepID=UPI0024759E01|nr:hypothetical protein [Cryobacterium sp. CG_9.6]MDH6235640.1 hypothetical protein [Cryobacterium sp. CG_9.6]
MAHKPEDILQHNPTELALTELSPTEWRVSDAACPEGDPSALLGFIQRIGPAYEVTNLGRLHERSYFLSFDRATASLSTVPLTSPSPVNRKMLS